jgi:hypothetical protein
MIGALAIASPAWAQDSEAEPEAASEETAADEAASEDDASEEEASEEGKPEAPAKPMMAPPPKPASTSMLPPPAPEDELPIPTLTIDRIPPSTSYEFAVQVSYGQVSYHRDAVPPWVGFGLRGGGGKNFGLHRIGAAGVFASEGDLGIHTLLVFEPSVTYDLVTPGGLLVGASAGPSIMYWADASTILVDSDFGIGPAASARLGWSQTWSRIGRRLFAFAEPKVRRANGTTDVLVAVAIGSGIGR